MSQHPVDPNTACADPEGGGGGGGGGGARGPEPPGKTQVILDYLGENQLNPPKKSWIPPPPPRKIVEAPLEPRKIIIFFEINHSHSVK